MRLRNTFLHEARRQLLNPEALSNARRCAVQLLLMQVVNYFTS